MALRRRRPRNWASRSWSNSWAGPGIAGPASLPDDVAAKWGEWMATAVKDEKFLTVMERAGSIIDLMDPAEAKTFIDGQYETFRKLVDELGMRIEG